MLLLFVAASISRYFFLLHPHITTRQFLSFILLYRFIFFSFLLYKLLRHCDIQVSLRLTILIYRRLAFYASHSRRAIYKPSMIHLYKLSKCDKRENTFLITQISAGVILHTERKIVFIKGFPTILVMQYICVLRLYLSTRYRSKYVYNPILDLLQKFYCT